MHSSSGPPAKQPDPQDEDMMDPLKHQQLVAQQRGIISYKTGIFSSAPVTLLPQFKNLLLLCHFTNQ